MKIYIASSWSNPFLNDIVSILRDWNHQVHDFRANGGNPARRARWQPGQRYVLLASAIYPNQLPTPVRSPSRCRSPALRPARRPLRPRRTRYGSRPLYPGGAAGPRRHRAGLDAPGRGRCGEPGSRQGRGSSPRANSRMTWRMHWPWPGIPRHGGAPGTAITWNTPSAAATGGWLPPERGGNFRAGALAAGRPATATP